ncbi:hypothetical protein PRIPAC_97516 [Pristionchus pacificus]|uniref:Uncharacterized protein n=1 Tax=Pristionchus pacificus TaxID=54126 RepID=A0A2A6BCP2_PRIPA|nr:hypothetical protein PRIPAC_97516 [Pristionchus pacificus]|eukprot:PDM63601.1 hypothetical protein PRIPAC_49574 [Pristionchus pacificus]
MAYNVLQQFNEMIATIAMEDVDRNHDFVCKVVSLFAKYYGKEFKVEAATLATHAVALFGYSAFRPRVEVCDRRIRPIYKLLNTYSLPLPDLKKILEENWVDLASFMYDKADMCILRKDLHTAKKILTEMEDAVGQHHEKVEELREYITEQETQKNTKFNAGTPPPSSTQSRGTVKKSGSKKRGRPSTASEAARKKDKKKKEIKKNGGRKTGVQKKKCTMKKQPNIEKALEKTRKR